MDIIATLTDDQQALLACVGLLLGSTIILALGYAFGRWTGRNHHSEASRSSDELETICLSDAMIDCGCANCRQVERAA